ncbi:MAG: InlB B-repeat-containing protein [Clostridia bacterium]|nr:InlB B-repeat-containing protein [Clostridia bacterium]
MQNNSINTTPSDALSSSTTYYKNGSNFYTLQSTSVATYYCTNANHTGTNSYTSSTASGVCYKSSSCSTCSGYGIMSKCSVCGETAPYIKMSGSWIENPTLASKHLGCISSGGKFIDVECTACQIGHKLSPKSWNYKYRNIDTSSTTTTTSAYSVATGYTISFNKNGGSGSMSSQYFLHGHSQAIKSNTFTRTGYTFKGWNTSSSSTSISYSNGQSVTQITSGSSATLYAIWTANTYYVKYNANGGSGTMDNSTHTYDTASALTTNAFTRTGYNFAGWATSETGAVAYADGASVSTLTTTNGEIYNLYAVWDARPHNINILINDSSLGSVLGGGAYVEGENANIYAFSQPGCAFLYWLDSADTSTKIFANPLNITITETKTYTAYFTDSLMSGVTCMAQEGGEIRMSGYNENDTVVHFSAVAYAGYTFDGWFISGDNTAISTDWSVDLAMDIIKDKLIVAHFSPVHSNVNTETSNTDNLT